MSRIEKVTGRENVRMDIIFTGLSEQEIIKNLTDILSEIHSECRQRSPYTTEGNYDLPTPYSSQITYELQDAGARYVIIEAYPDFYGDPRNTIISMHTNHFCGSLEAQILFDRIKSELSSRKVR